MSRLNIPGILCAFSFLFLSSCGGGGGGGGSGGSPPTVSATTVSGTVQAPGGQVSFSQPQTLLQQFAQFFSTTANASVNGLSPVPDGTTVELIRANAIATSFPVLSSTITDGGRYSFNLTSLGLEPSNDLVLRVANGAVQMRAFVTGSNVDIDPASEVAVQLVLERIVTTPGSTINHYTVQELADITGSINLLAVTKQLAAGGSLVNVITSIRNTVGKETNLMTFMNASAGPGQTTEGPGDIGNYFPFAQGNIWHYQGTVSLTGTPTVNFSDSRSITGTKTIAGVATTTIFEANHNDEGMPQEYYEVKDSRGMTNYGNNDSSDFITPQLAPLRTVRFPLAVGDAVEVLDRKSLNSGLDLDGDGIPEKVDVELQYNVLGFESATVQAGTFANAAKVEIRQTNTFFSSAFGISATIKRTETEWRAPGVGFIKKIAVNKSEGFLNDFVQTVTEELVGSIADGQGLGSVSETEKLILVTNDLIYDKISKKLYASTPGNPGSVTVIDPETATIGPSVEVGNQPNKLAVSENGQFLYVSLDGESAVRRVNLPLLIVELKFPLGPGTSPFPEACGPLVAEDIEVLPGRASSVAVSIRNGCSSHETVAIYDDGIRRPTSTPGWTSGVLPPINLIEFSQSASILYGQNIESSSRQFITMAVTAQGVSVTDSSSVDLSGLWPGDMKFAGGRIYYNSGHVLDPVSKSTIGRFQGTPFGSDTLMTPDAVSGRVFFFPGFALGSKLQAYDMTSLLQTGETLVENFNPNDSPRRLIRWGRNGLAFRTSGGEVFLVRTSLVP